MNGCHGFHDLREEVLERIWNLSEEGGARLAPLLEQFEGIAEKSHVTAKLDELALQGFLRTEGEAIDLTAEGEAIARHVVRAHRLAERLLIDLLELPPNAIENHACQLEHAITPELADSLCTLLGHPPESPDGRAIPRGSCCEVSRQEIEQAVYPLTSMQLGGTGRIVFIHPRRAASINQLSSLGFVAGTDVRLKQHHPAMVVEVGETSLALDRDVARDVFVKRIKGAAPPPAEAAGFGARIARLMRAPKKE